MAPLAKDLLGIGEEAEQGLRVGDTGPLMIKGFAGTTQTTATLVGGPTGATLLELNPVSGSSFVAFLASTEIDREFSVYNVASTANTVTIFTPSGSSFQSSAGSIISFVLAANKSATVSRIGQMPPVTASIAADRWIYTLSA